MHRLRFIAFVVLASLLPQAAGFALSNRECGKAGYRHRCPKPNTTPKPITVPYEVEFRGVEDECLENGLREVSKLILDQATPPTSLSGIVERAEDDLKTLVKYLHSQGYYSADVRFRLERRANPLKVVIIVFPGPRYPLVRFSILPAEGDPGVYPYTRIPLSSLGIELDKPAIAKDILGAQERLITILQCQGYALAKLVSSQAVVDATRLQLEMVLYVDSGPLCRFGPTRTEGLIKVSDRAVRKAIAWCEGERYSPNCVRETERRLRDMALFNWISVQHDDKAPEGVLPMQISVIERKQRTITIGATYNTRELFGVNATWYNRNLRRQGDKLLLEALYNERKALVGALYRDIQFRHPDQDLLIWAEAKDDRSNPGYDEKSAKIGSGLERRCSERFRYAYGAQAQQLQITESPDSGDFTVVSLPSSASWDCSNDLLDPTTGYTTFVDIQPATDLSSDFSSFFKASVTATAYLPLRRDRRIVLAGWTSLGMIVGSSLANVPPPYRFYAGTDSSLRGYSYKTVGPLDAQGKPIGGRSMMLYGVELRFRVAEKWGVITFFEMGNVFLNELPQFDQKMLKSWGLGVRYFTPIGPLSLDIGIPLDRRKGIDKPFQLYLSVGQAF